MKFFGEAEIANLPSVERKAYEESLKIYRDLKNVTDTAFDDGYHEAESKLLLRLEEERKQKEEAQMQKEDERKQKEEVIMQQRNLIKFLVPQASSLSQISEIIHLSEEKIQELLNQ